MNLRIGECFDGKFTILEQLGQGGYATVYKARQIDSGRIVALKIIQERISADEKLKAEFLKEAQALARLSHLNVVVIYQVGITDSDLAYLIMELIEGLSLRSLLNMDTQLPVQRALSIIRQAALALSYVHKQGIIHRDIKPENIVLVQQPEIDTVKIIDFGLAKVEDEKNQRLTTTGMVVGTVSYMSPEQCMGKRASPRSDIYSLAVCLYELLSGKKPFDADTPVGIMYKHINEKLPPLAANFSGKIAVSLNALCSKALAKDAANRYQSMDEFAAAIDRLLADYPAEPGLQTRQNSKKFAMRPALSLMLVILAAFGILFFCKKSFVKQNPEAILNSSNRNDKNKQKELDRALTLCTNAESLLKMGKLEDARSMFNRSVLSILSLAKMPLAKEESKRKSVYVSIIHRLQKMAKFVSLNDIDLIELHRYESKQMDKEIHAEFVYLAGIARALKRQLVSSTDLIAIAAREFVEIGKIERAKAVLKDAESDLKLEQASRSARELELIWARAYVLDGEGKKDEALKLAQNAARNYKKYLPDMNSRNTVVLRRIGVLLRSLGDERNANYCFLNAGPDLGYDMELQVADRMVGGEGSKGK